MAVINRGSYPITQVEAAVKAWFGDENNDYIGQTEKLYKVMTSDKGYEYVQELIGMGYATVRSEGQAATYDTTRQGLGTRFVHAQRVKGFIVTQRLLADNVSGLNLVERHTRMIANSLKQSREKALIDTFNNAFDSAYAGGDGKELCATDHPLSGGGVQQNELTSPLDLSEVAIEEALVAISNMVDAAGYKVNAATRLLLVPGELKFEGDRIVNSMGQVYSADNTLNAIKSTGSLPEGVMVNNNLTDTDAWFIISKNISPGLLHFKRDSVAISSHVDFDTDNVKFKAVEDYSTGWADFRDVFGSPGV